MFEIKVSKEIKDACPVFAGAAVYAVVKNTAYSEGLWQEIDAFTRQLTSTTQMEDSCPVKASISCQSPSL